MRIELCELCKLSSDLPEGCVSCAMKNETERRVKLERQLLDLLGRGRSLINSIEVVVRASGLELPNLPLLPEKNDSEAGRT